VLLQGSLQEFSLPNVLNLVKMSAKTGVLSLRRKGDHGLLYFRDGHVYYATLEPQIVPLGERLVRAGHISPEQLAEALAEQRDAAEGIRIGGILVAKGFLQRGTLVEAVADQIEEAAFSLLTWTEGEFEFRGGGPAADEDIIVELSVDGVIMDGVRRLDEWDLIINSLGSLQHVPRLAWDEEVVSRGGVQLSAEDWRVVSSVDGRRDIGSIIRECGLNRFAAAKVLYRLANTGLVVMKPAAIQGLEDATAIVVRGPIDFYNEVFLSSLNEETLTRHLLTEVVGENEIEVPITAVTLPAEEEGGLETLVLTMAVGTPESAWRLLAARCVAAVLLVNANSLESSRASAIDLASARAVERLPFVVATYVSVSEEGLPVGGVAEALRLADDVQVLPCDLHSREGVRAVVQIALASREDEPAQQS
jgi:Domain of unknown function (DUF4388)